MPFWDMVFPKKCIHCESISKNMKCGLCNKCFGSIRPQLRLKGSLNYLLIYDRKVKRIINKAKYGKTNYFVEIGKYMGEQLKNEEIPQGVITYVPITKKDLGSRGFNQSEIIAKAIAEVLTFDCLPLIKKTRQNKKQASLSFEKRMDNVKEVYEPIQKKISYDRIYIVDDIYTTGNTLWACKQALKNHYPQEISYVTLAYVRKRKFYTGYPQPVDKNTCGKRGKH